MLKAEFNFVRLHENIKVFIFNLVNGFETNQQAALIKFTVSSGADWVGYSG